MKCKCGNKYFFTDHTIITKDIYSTVLPEINARVTVNGEDGWETNGYEFSPELENSEKQEGLYTCTSCSMQFKSLKENEDISEMPKEYVARAYLYLKVDNNTAIEESSDRLRDILEEMVIKYPEFSYLTSFGKEEIREIY